MYANQKCEEIIGYTRDELYAPHFDFLDLISSEYVEFTRKNFLKHMNGEEVEPLEYALITKDGQRIEAILATKLINYENEKAILGIITDITKRKQAEKALKKAYDELQMRVKERISELNEANKNLKQKIVQREETEQTFQKSEEKYRNLVERASDGIIIVQDSLIRYKNRRMAEISGYSY